MAYYKKPEDLQSIRDKLFDGCKAALAVYIAGLESVPEWLAATASNLHVIKSKQRILDLVNGWVRHAGDEEVYAVLVEWRRREIHLERWESDQRAKFERWRRNFYANFWARLRREYAEVVVDDTNYAAMRVKPDADDNASEAAAIEYRNLTSPGLLLSRHKDRRAGRWYCWSMPAVVVPAKNLTARCGACKGLCKWDQASDLVHACEHCGETWDQDDNHCRNALASAEVVDETLGAAR